MWWQAQFDTFIDKAIENIYHWSANTPVAYTGPVTVQFRRRSHVQSPLTTSEFEESLNPYQISNIGKDHRKNRKHYPSRRDGSSWIIGDELPYHATAALLTPSNSRINYRMCHSPQNLCPRKNCCLITSEKWATSKERGRERKPWAAAQNKRGLQIYSVTLQNIADRLLGWLNVFEDWIIFEKCLLPNFYCFTQLCVWIRTQVNSQSAKKVLKSS